MNAAAAGGRGGGKGQFRRTGSEPFDLLQLDSASERVANDGVEATDWLVVLPIEDDAGKMVCGLFCEAAAFGSGVFEETGLCAMLGAEGGSSEEEAEGADGMETVAGVEDGFKINFVVAASAG